MLRRLPLAIVALGVVMWSSETGAQTEHGRFARLAILRPHDGDDTITFGERQRWFVYGTFTA